MESKDFVYFLTVSESGEMVLDIGSTRLYYCKDKNQMHILSEFRAGEYYKSHFPDAMSIHTMEVEDKPASVKDVLETFLIEYISSPLVRNYPYFEQSDLFTAAEYKRLYENSLAPVRERWEKAKLNTTELTETCSRYSLNPVPVNEDGTSWKANCPSGGHHWIMIAGEQWGCGYCRKKGGIEELVSWLGQVKGKRV